MLLKKVCRKFEERVDVDSMCSSEWQVVKQQSCALQVWDKRMDKQLLNGGEPCT